MGDNEELSVDQETVDQKVISQRLVMSRSSKIPQITLTRKSTHVCRREQMESFAFRD